MRSLIFTTAIKVLVPVFLVFSIYLFIRGHDQPGGGFIAALVASIIILFHLIALGRNETKKLYNISAFKFMGLGLSTALISAIVPLFSGKAMMEALWLDVQIPLLGKVGTPILFDLGVYLLVMGVMLTIAFSLFEDE